MKTISVLEAMGNAPPRSAAVLCARGAGGAPEMILVEWFTWLNIKRNPMISFSMRRDAPMGANLKAGEPLVLAFPPQDEALKYKQGVRLEEGDPDLPEGVEPVRIDGVPVPVPRGSEVVLRCTLAGAYNYPFKKVRIHNCNLEKALGERRDAARKALPRSEDDT